MDTNKVVGLVNFTGAPVAAKLADGLAAGSFNEFGSGAVVQIKAGDSVTVPANGYRLLATTGAQGAPPIMQERQATTS